MTPVRALPRLSRRNALTLVIALAAVGLALVFARTIVAQVEGDRGIAAVASSSDIAVGGIEVDVTAKDAGDARQDGWRLAQRKAWEKIGGPNIPDGQIQSMVSSMVIEHEELGPHRYIARLGVVFDRTRAGGLLGRGGEVQHSAPMLLVPVTFTAGSQTVYEVRNPWQRAWAEYQPGASSIDYVRPSGAGGDSLLLTYGQTSRRSRTWWRNVLDQFGASDVLVAIADLHYRWPGGPVDGQFTARYGPDDIFLGTFTMTARSPAELQAMLDQAVLRFNTMYEGALANGLLKPDPTLNLGEPQLSPAIMQLIEAGRAAQERDRAAAAAAQPEPGATPSPAVTLPASAATPTAVTSYVVQFATPNAGAVDMTLALVRSVPGVRSASSSSLAIGGTSVMSVSYAGSLTELAAALKGRGFTVRQGGNAIAISR
ncbi:MAG: heavy-metal-associated domain-containing protein [Tsuneonella sp.]